MQPSSRQAKQPKGELLSAPFCDLLREHRRAAGMTQGFLAERARLSPAAVSALERGRRQAPYRATVALLADALALSDKQRAEFELAAEYGRARGAPPGAPFAPPANNLPTHLTSFIGRENELAELSTLLGAHRLVTVTGAGGVGKTRTSLQFGKEIVHSFRDGVWFIELAPLTSGDYTPSSVARTLGLTLALGCDPVKSLTRALKDKHALLVFDNCEHLLESSAHVVAAILKWCPNVKVLATSRHVLGIAGEAAYRMPSLTAAAAISLFAERARVADYRFALTDENASIVADICRRLDGIPLALELASSRMKMLSPRELRGRLEERFRVLTGGSRDAPSRQQTLRALFDWSHDLLDQRERVLLRRLGIFVNGFTLDAAETVASGADLDEREVFDLVASLVDNSLVLAEPHGNSLRYRLLESTRAYALEKLTDAGERDLVAGRHLRYLRDRFAQLFEQYEQTVRRTDIISALQTDLEDIRSALDGALARSEIIDGGALLTSIYTCWQDIGLATEGSAWCERYLAELPDQELRLRARLLTELSYLLLWSGHQLRAFELGAEAVELARASGDGSSLEWALRIYSFAATRLNRLDDAERALTQAEAVPAVSANDRHGLLAARAYYSQASGDYDTAANLNEQIREECRALENVLFQNLATHNLAEVEHKRGRTQRAITLVREMLLTVRSAPHTSMFSAVSMYVNLAGYLIAVDDLLGAAEAASEAIAIVAEREPDDPRVAIAIEHLALVVAQRGDLAAAAILEGYAETALQRHGTSRQFTELTTHDRLTALLREQLLPYECARLVAEGAALAPKAAIALALRLKED